MLEHLAAHGKFHVDDTLKIGLDAAANAFIVDDGAVWAALPNTPDDAVVLVAYQAVADAVEALALSGTVIYAAPRRKPVPYERLAYALAVFEAVEDKTAAMNILRGALPAQVVAWQAAHGACARGSCGTCRTVAAAASKAAVGHRARLQLRPADEQGCPDAARRRSRPWCAKAGERT